VAHRTEFIQGLELIVEAVEEMARQGHSRPVLVGGAAVEFWTGSAVMSGDFDMITERQQLFETILQSKGFMRPQGVGALLRGLHHPKLGVGVEVVSGPLFDGLVPEDRLVMVAFHSGSLLVVGVEDSIADRMGQYASHEASNGAMLEQAIQLLRLASAVDEAYLDKRIQEETAGCYGLGFLKQKLGDYENAYLRPGRG
jgi:hypothetical protein